MQNDGEIIRRETDALLVSTQRDSVAGRGRLRIFFGYAAGVGKTYAMLQAAHTMVGKGCDVVVGCIEQHVQPETLALVEGLESIPMVKLIYRKHSLYEPDFDAILQRKPQIVLLDELPHTNEAGMRHRKRYQYLDELLEAGIDVFTTMNVQHLESLNDVVASITGIMMQETVPDNIFFDANQVELIDIEPECLLERLRMRMVNWEGKAQRVTQGIFSAKNLTALRELALRATADRVSRSVEIARQAQTGTPVWATSDRVLVAIGGSPWSARLVRAAHRLAFSIKAPWIALHIVTHENFSTVENRECVRTVLKLAESLGAETAVIRGEKSAKDILSFARTRNVTKIVAGRDIRRNSLLRLIRPSLSDTLLKEQGDIDIYLVHGEPLTYHQSGTTESPIKKGRDGYLTVFGTVLIMLLVLGLSMLFDRFGIGEANIIMVHFLGAFFAAIAFGRNAGLGASLWSVLQFNFFFTEPRLTFIVYNPRYVPLFMIMFLVAIVTASLASRLRRQSDIIRRQEAQTYQLYLFGQSLAEASDIDEILTVSCNQLKKIYTLESAFFIPNIDGVLIRHAASKEYQEEEYEPVLLAWCFKNGKPAGRGTDTHSDTQTRFEPIKLNGETIGVVSLLERDTTSTSADVMHIDTALSLIGRALERERLIEERRQATIRAESERVRSSLLRSVSHDLRTPLSGIAGAAESLNYAELNPDTIAAIALDIEQEAERLSLLVENILNLTRLQEDPTKLRKSKESVDDLVYAAAETARKRYPRRVISVELGENPEIVDVDPILIQQLLLNYIDNADKYSPPGASIELSVKHLNNEILILVRDHGEGIPSKLTTHIFEKFVRAYPGDGTKRGSGLGLYICENISKAHNGRVFVETAEGGGSIFGLALPSEEIERGDEDAKTDDPYH